MKEKLKTVQGKLMPKDSSNFHIKRAVKYFFSLEEIKSAKIVYYSCILLALLVSFSSDTVNIVKQLSEGVLTLFITIFAGLLTFYTIIMSIINKQNIQKLIKLDDSLFINAVYYYENILFIYFLGIFITLFVWVFMLCIPEDYILIQHHWINEPLAFILIYAYMASVFRLIYELKSTIYNTVTLTRASIINIIDEITKD